MPNGGDVGSLIANPDFQGLAPADKRSALAGVTKDDSFLKLNDGETMQFISGFPKKLTEAQMVAQRPGQVAPQANVNQLANTPTSAMGMVGAGVGDEAQGNAQMGQRYVQAGPMEVGRGVQDIAKGNIARGAHRAITGAGVTALPAVASTLPIAAMSAPVATGLSLAGGIAGQQIGSRGAAYFGATPDQAALAGDVGGLLGGYGGYKAAGALPSAARAGAQLNEIRETLGDHTIDVAGPGNEALRAREIAQAGGRMPKVINDFLRRATDPDKGPITLAEGRDMYTNATKLSSGEYQQLTGPMKMQLARFVQELGSSLNEAVARAGRGTALQDAINEFSAAKGMTSGLKWAGGAAGLVSLEELGRRAIQKVLPK